MVCYSYGNSRCLEYIEIGILKNMHYEGILLSRRYCVKNRWALVSPFCGLYLRPHELFDGRRATDIGKKAAAAGRTNYFPTPHLTSTEHRYPPTSLGSHSMEFSVSLHRTILLLTLHYPCLSRNDWTRILLQ